VAGRRSRRRGRHRRLRAARRFGGRGRGQPVEGRHPSRRGGRGPQLARTPEPERGSREGARQAGHRGQDGDPVPPERRGQAGSRHHERRQAEAREVTPPAATLVRRFRALIALEAALTIASLIASVALRRTLPESLQAFLRADDAAPARALALPAAVGVAIVMAMMLTAWIGLWRFWRIAPPLFAAAWIGVGVVTLMAGPTVQTAIETVVYTAWS